MRVLPGEVQPGTGTAWGRLQCLVQVLPVNVLPCWYMYCLVNVLHCLVRLPPCKRGTHLVRALSAAWRSGENVPVRWRLGPGVCGAGGDECCSWRCCCCCSKSSCCCCCCSQSCHCCCCCCRCRCQAGPSVLPCCSAASWGHLDSNGCLAAAATAAGGPCQRGGNLASGCHAA